eukprot:403343357
MDDNDSCIDLNLRLQSVLVKQHVLEALKNRRKGRKNNGYSSGNNSSSDDGNTQQSQDSIDYDDEGDFNSQLDKRLKNHEQSYQNNSGKNNNKNQLQVNSQGSGGGQRTFSHYAKNHIKSLQNSNRKDSDFDPYDQNRNRIDSNNSNTYNNNSLRSSDKSSIDEFEKQQFRQKQEIQEMINQEFEKQQYRQKLEIQAIIEQEMKRDVQIEHNISQDNIQFDHEYEKHRKHSRRNSKNSKSGRKKSSNDYVAFNVVEENNSVDQLEKSGFNSSMIKEAYIKSPSTKPSSQQQTKNIQVLNQSNQLSQGSGSHKKSNNNIVNAQLEEIKQSKEQGIQIIQNEQNNQIETLQERLRNRKLNKMIKTQMDMTMNNQNNSQQDRSILNGLFGATLLSPQNTISPPQFQFGQVSPKNNGTSTNLGDFSGDNFFLRDLDDNLDLEQDDGQFEDQEEAESLQELEKRKEEILEEYLEYAFARKHEEVEAIKADCKLKKLPRDQEKKLVTDVQKQMDLKRKDGMNELAKKMHEIIYEDAENMSLQEKMERLQDKEQIQMFIESVFALKIEDEEKLENDQEQIEVENVDQ